MSQTLPARKASSAGRLGRLAVSTLLVFGLVAAPATVAQAAETTLSGTQYADVVIHQNVLRTNSFYDNRVSIRVTNAGHGGGALTVGIRKSSTGIQYAKTSSGASGTWKSLTTSTGSTAIPIGSFYTNTRLSGACGGNGCGLMSWSTGFRWNIKW
jgi:hypothetical protein